MCIRDRAVPEDSTAYGLAYFYLGATYYVKNDFDNMFDMMANALVYLKQMCIRDRLYKGGVQLHRLVIEGRAGSKV